MQVKIPIQKPDIIDTLPVSATNFDVFKHGSKDFKLSKCNRQRFLVVCRDIESMGRRNGIRLQFNKYSNLYSLTTRTNSALFYSMDLRKK